VVVHEVPAGATVVGVPGRQVEDGNVQQQARFAAYAVVQNQDDPYAKAIQTLVEHSHELEQTVAALQERLQRLEGELAARESGDPSKTEPIRIVK
jgi:serine O-acetyltransferase